MGFFLANSAAQVVPNDPNQHGLCRVNNIFYYQLSVTVNLQGGKEESILFNRPDQDAAHQHVSFLATASCLFFKNLPLAFFNSLLPI